jgi:hypothetical protein
MADMLRGVSTGLGPPQTSTDTQISFSAITKSFSVKHLP